MSHTNRNLCVVLTGIVILMLCLSYISVPLYKIFCETTGFGGTPKKGTNVTACGKSRVLKVQLISNVHRDLPWRFKPLENEVTVRVGENALTFFQATNETDEPITGMATYNVSPDKAAQYFVKVACFCFEEQLLQPKQTVDMPVNFYIDPAIDNDHDLCDVKKIVLSYTFFRYRK